MSVVAKRLVVPEGGELPPEDEEPTADSGDEPGDALVEAGEAVEATELADTEGEEAARASEAEGERL